MTKDQIQTDIKDMKATVAEENNIPAMQMLLYGSAGIGKTTFAKYAEQPYFLDLENGCIGVSSKQKKAFPIIGYNSASQGSMEALNTFLDQVLTTKQELPFKTLVLDSLTRLDEFAEHAVVDEAKQRSKKSESILTIGDLPFGSGYAMARDKIMQVVYKCIAISIQKDINLIMIAHSKDKQVNKLGALTYDAVCPRLSKGALASITELVPLSFYLGKEIKGDDGGGYIKRGLFTSPDVFCENVKSRINLDQEVYDLAHGDAITKMFWSELNQKWCEANA